MKRTHVVSIYRSPVADSNPYDTEDPAWTLVEAGVHGNLQPLTGSVQQSAAGRAIGATWRAFLPPTTDVREDDGIRVTSGVGPNRYRVRQVGEQATPWDTEVLLAATEEEFE